MAKQNELMDKAEDVADQVNYRTSDLFTRYDRISPENDLYRVDCRNYFLQF